MPRTRTLLEMRTEALEALDLEDSSYASDPELTRRANQGITRLYNLLVKVNGDDYFRTATTLSTVANNPIVSLGAVDWYKILGVDVPNQAGPTEFRNAHTFNWTRRNDYRDNQGWANARVRYALRGNSLQFFPLPDQVYTIQLWYVPTATQLSADGDTFDGINGWEDYVVHHMSVWLANKRGEDAKPFILERELIRKEIEAQAPKRDKSGADHPRDVRRRRRYGGASREEYDRATRED